MNFLQRAVAGVESKLDQVLAGDPNLSAESQSLTPATSTVVTGNATTPSITQTAAPSSAATSAAASPVKDAKPTPPVSASPTPPPSFGRMTMQERLAAAMARGGSVRSGSPALLGNLSDRATSPTPSRKSTDTNRDDSESNEIGRKSEDIKGEEKEKVEPPSTVEIQLDDDNDDDNEKSTDEKLDPSYTNGVEPPRTSTDAPRQSLDSQARTSLDIKSRTSLDSKPRTSLEVSKSTITPSLSPAPQPPTIEDLEATVSQLREDLSICESRRAEESTFASERIDSLEEKLKYLAKESAEESRKRIQAGGASALEKELAKRDERIALLLEEGERLSKTELKHMNNIKRLRAKTQEEEKATAEAKRKQDRAEKEAADLREKTRKAIEAEKRANEKVRLMNKLEVDNECLKRERDILQISTSDLKLQLAKAVARADDAESKVQTEALEAERKLTAELKDKLEKSQNDAIADKERYKSETWTLQSKLERDGDRAKAVELELKNEISMLETKLEVMRARAEEASTGTSGHTHAKLLRQIETLQSQYAVASENWQGIEASLMSRLTSVEKERDELSRKENDVRKKAREVNQKLKRLESDLESATFKTQDLESSLTTQLALCEDLRKQVSLHEESKLQLSKKFDEERLLWQKEIKDVRESLKATTSAALIANEDYSMRPKSRPNSILEVEGVIRPISPHPRRKQSIGSDVNAPFPSKRMSRTDSGDRINDIPAGWRRSTLPEPTRQYTSSSWGPSPQPPTPRMDSGSGYSSGGNNGPASRQSSLFGGFAGLGMGISYPSTPSLNTSLMSPGAAGPMPIESDNESIFEGQGVNGGLLSPGSHEGRNGAHIGDMLSVSTVAAGPSVQLVERMSAAVRRLESEMASSREELARITAQRDEARAEVVGFMTEIDEKRSLEERVGSLEAALTEKESVYEATLIMLGEKSEEAEELKNDVADLKQMYKDLVMSQTT
ncbi:hypothetical protein H072_3169 [Dactylellina haptotyla CBS 200.50]|uniref:TATA element modulatory factor 1 TATA binding domain-containing protein n=1 Tax=Dactylellina haptotyla (strain CBS 200.50) TaxID=1284197 RepID=S8AIR9_DACHA|nr:hypothetical protein H072_3169 [Dactylellina haptotyla CBS 200.50]